MENLFLNKHLTIFVDVCFSNITHLKTEVNTNAFIIPNWVELT